MIEIAFGLGGLARLMRFIPRSVMLGFVNALGILIFVAQVPHVLNVTWPAYALFALTLAIIFVVPRLTKAGAVAAHRDHRRHRDRDHRADTGADMADEGEITGRLPGITPLLVPLDLETLRLIWPTALSIAFVGLMETLLTAKLVDEMTDTRSHKGRESWALGVSNILAAAARRQSPAAR